MSAISILGMLATPVASQDTTLARSSGPGLGRNPRLVEELRIGRVSEVPGSKTQHVKRIEREYQPVRVSRGKQSEWQARADYWTKLDGPRGASSGVQVPDVKPPIRSVSVDSDDRIWVDRYVAAVKRRTRNLRRPGRVALPA